MGFYSGCLKVQLTGAHGQFGKVVFPAQMAEYDLAGAAAYEFNSHMTGVVVGKMAPTN